MNRPWLSFTTSAICLVKAGVHCHLGEGSALLPRDIFRFGSFSAGARHRIPFNERAGAEQAVVRRPQEVSTDSDERLHDPVHRRESLELSGRREPSHLALPRSCRVMRDLRISDVDHRRHHGAARGGVGAPLVGDQSSRETALGV